jgi:chromosome partitioning protein
MEGLARFNATVSLVQDVINSNLKLDGGVMTMYDARMNLSNQVKDEVQKHYGKKVYKTVIPRNVRLAEAPSFGQTIFTYDPACKGAVSYFNLAVEFLVRRGANPKDFESLNTFVEDTSVNCDSSD